ncbi:MAG TPA: PQQ-binding-like beta-propeller repeat protein, partial [Planctomycetota bacterium]|nr:PQQ-binding-like beta-propeller repeat protein [Planctomycetota bacterium]
MFNRPFQEHTASPPLVADGSVYVCTNLGVAGCLDAWSGRIRWLTGYESTVRRPSRSPEHDQRRDVHWLNDPPLLVGGRLLVTPLDSGKLFAYDPGTGRTLWSLDSRELGGDGSRHQLLASASGAVLLLGDERLERLDIVRGSVAGSLTIVPPEGSDGLTGRATVCGERVLVPLESKLLVCDAGELRVVDQREWPRRPYPVRMAQVADAVLLATDNDSLFAAVDLERALDELASRASGSPEALLRFAELSLSAGHLAEAEAGFDALIDSETGAWRERAVSGRIKASLDGARLQDDVEHWTGVLQVALRLGDVWSVAPEALESLDDLGAASVPSQA